MSELEDTAIKSISEFQLTIQHLKPAVKTEKNKTDF